MRKRYSDAEEANEGFRRRLQEAQEALKARRLEQLAAERVSSEMLAAARRDQAMALAAPLPWPSHYSGFKIERLPPGDPVHELLSELFVGSAVSHRRELHSPEFCPAPLLEILKVDAVVNPRLAKLYHAKAEEIQGLSRGICSEIPALARLKIPHRKGGAPSWPELNEHFLFHGATCDVVTAIGRGGFDPRRGGEANARMFGLATYFAANSSKADIYTELFQYPLKRHDQRQVVVARVLLGEAYCAVQKMSDATRPPDDANGHPLDSVWAEKRDAGGAVDHHEVMIYDKGQALPEYVITYRHKFECACAECLKRPL